MYGRRSLHILHVRILCVYAQCLAHFRERSTLFYVRVACFLANQLRYAWPRTTNPISLCARDRNDAI